MDDSTKVVEHLKIIQPIITRMSSAMLSIKAFSLTTFSFLVGLAIKDKVLEIFFIVFPLILIFLVLDIFYLWQEKLYQGLYDDTRTSDKTDFNMDTKKYKKTIKYFACIKSIAIWPFYVLLLICNGILLYISLNIGGV
jgi:hypothetical protein